MNSNTFSLLAALALVAAGALSPVEAATITCNTGDPRTVTLNDGDADTLDDWGCGPSGATNTLNEGRYFRSQGLFEIAKLEGDDGDELANDFFRISGLNGTSGEFEIFDAAIAADGLFLVFKFGGARISPDWISFEINGATTGTWDLNCEGAACTGLSHVTLVPEPGMLALFGAGILGAGLLRRRRRATR